MNRRDFARQTIGALFGVSLIPEFGEKPKLFLMADELLTEKFPDDISIATQIHLNERLS